jgi:hypothetical protein
MMAQIVMRKCEVTFKQAKEVVKEARLNLDLCDESMLWSKELQAECFRLVEIKKDKEREEKEAANALLFESGFAPIRSTTTANSKPLSGEECGPLFGPHSSSAKNGVNQLTPPPRRRNTIQRQRSKSFSPPCKPSRLAPFADDDAATTTSENAVDDDICSRYNRCKYETRSKNKVSTETDMNDHVMSSSHGTGKDGSPSKTRRSESLNHKAVLKQHLNAQRPTRRVGSFTETECATASSSSVVGKQEKTDRKSVKEDRTVLDKSSSGDNVFVRPKSVKPKGRNLSPSRSSGLQLNLADAKMSTDNHGDDENEASDGDDDHGCIPYVRSKSLQSQAIRDLADSVRRKSLKSRSRSQSRSRISRRIQMINGAGAGEDVSETEASEVDLEEVDECISKFAEAIGSIKAETGRSSRRDKSDENVRSRSKTRRMISKEDFEAACRNTEGDPVELAKTLRLGSTTKHPHSRVSTSKVLTGTSFTSELPAEMESPRRSKPVKLRGFSSPVKTRNPKTTKPTAPDFDNENDNKSVDSRELDPRKLLKTKSSTQDSGQAEPVKAKLKLLRLSDLNDDRLNKSQASLKSTGSKQCMVPVFRSLGDSQSPTTRRVKSPVRKTISPERSSSPIRAKGSPMRSSLATASNLPKTTNAKDWRSSLKSVPIVDCSEVMNDNDEYTNATQSLTSSSSSFSNDLATKQNQDTKAKILSARPGSPVQQTSFRLKPLRKHGVTRQSSAESLNSTSSSDTAKGVKVKRRSKITKDREALKLARRARQSDLRA